MLNTRGLFFSCLTGTIGAFASVLGKVTFSDSVESALVRAALFAVMVATNAVMLRTFHVALQNSSTTIAAREARRTLWKEDGSL